MYICKIVVITFYGKKIILFLSILLSLKDALDSNSYFQDVLKIILPGEFKTISQDILKTAKQDAFYFADLQLFLIKMSCSDAFKASLKDVLNMISWDDFECISQDIWEKVLQDIF